MLLSHSNAFLKSRAAWELGEQVKYLELRKTSDESDEPSDEPCDFHDRAWHWGHFHWSTNNTSWKKKTGEQNIQNIISLSKIIKAQKISKDLIFKYHKIPKSNSRDIISIYILHCIDMTDWNFDLFPHPFNLHGLQLDYNWITMCLWGRLSFAVICFFPSASKPLNKRRSARLIPSRSPLETSMKTTGQLIKGSMSAKPTKFKSNTSKTSKTSKTEKYHSFTYLRYHC